MVLLLQLLAMKKREKEEELRALRLSVAAEKKKSEDNLEWSKMQAEKDRMSHSIVGREWMMDNRRQKALQKQEEEYTLRSAVTVTACILLAYMLFHSGAVQCSAFPGINPVFGEILIPQEW